MTERFVDLAEGLLDHQLIDAVGRRCGKVDDLELEWRPGEPMRVTAIVSGPGAWVARVPKRARRLFALLLAPTGRGSTRIAWEHVREVGPAVRLDVAATELGLSRGDDVVGRLVARLPGS
jgi:sporulation protein YlmC with PRC-barrel domain